MIERDSLELLINIQAKGQEVLASLAKTTKAVEDADKAATSAHKDLDRQLSQTSANMGASVVKAQLLAEGIMRLAGAVKNYTFESAQYAARTEQVASIMDNLARVNGMSITSVRMQADAVRSLGITYQESRSIINQMIGSQMSLGKSLELTRLAQNAAKVAGISSSEALARMIQGITSGEVEVLRHLGIQVSFEAAYKKAADALHINTNALTEQQKVQIRTDAVLARSPLLDGSYITSLTTAAGQMQSLQRYSDDLKNALGNGLQPALQDIVRWMRDANKYALENADGFQKAASAASALAVAGTVFAATPFLPLPFRAGAAVAAGAGAYALGAQDPVQARVDSTKDALIQLDHMRDTYSKQLRLGIIDKETFDRFSEQIPKYREMLRAQLIEGVAPIFKQRQQLLQKMPVPSGPGMRAQGAFAFDDSVPYNMAKQQATINDYDLGSGMRVTRSDIEGVMNGGEVQFDKQGLIAKNPLLKQSPATGDDKNAARKAKQIQDRVDRLIESLREYALSELEKFDSQINFQLQDLKGDGAKASDQGRFLSAAMEKRRVLLDNALNPQQNKARMDMTLFLAPTAAQIQGAGPSEVNGRMPVHQLEVDPQRNADALAKVRERALQGIQRYVSFQEQMVRLTAGPGGEYAALQQIMQLRIEGANKEFIITKDRARFEAEVDSARKDRVLAIAQLQQQELEKYKQAAGSVWDAMVSKGIGGIGDFMRGQLLVVGRTMFQNLAVEMFKQSKDALHLGDAIGGQVDKNGKLTTLGRVLQGTPLGVDQGKMVMEQNTTETRMNTQATRDVKLALDSLRGALGTAGTGTASGGIADATGDVLDKATGSSKLASKFSKVMTSAVTIGAGVYGVTQGINQGGAKGALNAAGGAAGMASGLISSHLFGAAAASGPLAPIMAGVAIALPLIAGMFGQTKEKFDQQQTDTLNRNKYTEATAGNHIMELRGGDVDYDYTGRLRTANDKTTIIQFSISAMDAKSFLDRSGDIADALHKELRLGNRVGLDIQQAILNG